MKQDINGLGSTTELELFFSFASNKMFTNTINALQKKKRGFKEVFFCKKNPAISSSIYIDQSMQAENPGFSKLKKSFLLNVFII